MDQNNEQWDGVAFMDAWIAKIDKGLTCVKEDHAAQKQLPAEMQAIAYNKEQIAQVVVMMVTAVHRAAIAAGIDHKVYTNALQEQNEKAQAQANLRKTMEEIFGSKEELMKFVRERQQGGSANG